MKTIRNFPKPEGWLSNLSKAMLAIAMIVSIVSIYSCSKEYETCPPSMGQADQSGVTAGKTSGLTISPNSSGLIYATGILEGKRVTTYQYGSYELIVPGEHTTYALRSATVNLNKFVNKNVEIKGYAIAGYPADGGPMFVDVVWVKEVVPQPISVIGMLVDVGSGTYEYKYGWGYKLVNIEYPTTYFLKSTTLDLSKYVNEGIKITGMPESFYPGNAPEHDNFNTRVQGDVTYLNVFWIMGIAVKNQSPDIR